MHEIPKLDAKGLRHFALSTGVVIAALFGAALPWLFGWSLPWWPWGLGAALILWGLIAPETLRPIYRGWMRLGLLINRVTTPLILGIVFALAFVPMGAVMRLLGHDPMRRRLKIDAATYREPSHEASRESMEKPF
jgi:Kef-type K+ transport system membrane component KefB